MALMALIYDLYVYHDIRKVLLYEYRKSLKNPREASVLKISYGMGVYSRGTYSKVGVN